MSSSARSACPTASSEPPGPRSLPHEAHRYPSTGSSAGLQAWAPISLLLLPAQHAQVTTSHDLRTVHLRQGPRGRLRQRGGQDPARTPRPLRRLRTGTLVTRGVPHGVREGEEVILAGGCGLKACRQADHLPASGGCEGLDVLLAQVVGLRLTLSGQGAQHDRGVGVDTRQRRDGGILAAWSAAASDGSHRRRLPRLLPAPGSATRSRGRISQSAPSRSPRRAEQRSPVLVLAARRVEG